MAEAESAPWRQTSAPQAVADSTGGSSFTVQCSEWRNLLPEVAEMVAPPIVVSRLPVDTRPRYVEKGANGRHRRPAPVG